jgi:hypothetical protein
LRPAEPGGAELIAAGGDSCGAWNNNTFGTEVFSTSYDPDMFKGWYTRPMDWEVGASVQREIRSGMSLEVGYHRRWIDKWTLIENTLNTHADFDPYSVVAPTDPRLDVASGVSSTTSGTSRRPSSVRSTTRPISRTTPRV